MNIMRRFVLLSLLLSGGLVVGCDRKEKVLDVETPEAGLEIERDKDSGAVTIDVDTDDEE